MKKLLLLLPLWLLPCLAAAQPQSVVWEMSSLNYDTTIVRHWQGDEYIVYSSSGAGLGINTDDRGRHHCTIWELFLPPYSSINIPETNYYETIAQICFKP